MNTYSQQLPQTGPRPQNTPQRILHPRTIILPRFSTGFSTGRCLLFQDKSKGHIRQISNIIIRYIAFPFLPLHCTIAVTDQPLDVHVLFSTSLPDGFSTPLRRRHKLSFSASRSALPLASSHEHTNNELSCDLHDLTTTGTSGNPKDEPE